MAHLLSLDFGTGGVRVAVFDSAGPRLIAQDQAPYGTRYLKPNRVEQNPLDWWDAACAAVPRVLAKAGATHIDAICVATTASTVVFADAAGTPLAPAIVWMDARAASEASETGQAEHPVMADSGGSDAVEWLVPKAMWTARNQPELWARTEIVCEAIDFINHRLTGLWAGSRMNATCKWNWNGREGRFHSELYDRFGIPELIEKIPSRIVNVGAPVGQLSAAAASQLGITGSPLVVQGGIDAHMGILGADTVAPGRMLVIGGTSSVLLTHAAEGRSGAIEGVWGPYPNALVEGLMLIEGGQVSSGAVLSWLTEKIFGLDSTGFTALCAQAGEIAPDATGLLALDYWMGNRTPYRDANLRGAILGLTMWQDRAAIFRACTTAVALGSANIVADLERQGVPIEEIVIAGGICRNPLWLQATIDAIGKPVGVAMDDNLSLYGCAASAATGLGLAPDLGAAAARFAAPVTPREPDMALNSCYRDQLVAYREATQALAPLLHKLAGSGATPPQGEIPA
ncbi:FGGY-family carbohydrate kinase [Pelagibacterium montanilacus]|uniref:FGGY-family carbohydrate kinase n=1 Tax=Pelagibacterium montanilacus TaxID=2185280 RepID=UPI000F8EE4EF|nr:FGGY-family carbohydrate kinase [Pelagibacterium montanilacus]